jgi:GTPase SAR1 family protein
LQLAELLAQRGDTDQLRARADAGDRYAALQLAELLAERGDTDQLRARANVGDEAATRQLAELLAERGDADQLRARADAGDTYAATQLAELRARLDYAVLDRLSGFAEARRYTNAKVVLLGDTGVGKSGLGMVLGRRSFRPTESTQKSTVWTLALESAAESGGSQAREILVWDLAGQPGYRIIHQLHLNDVSVALVVFDSRSETDPLAGVKYWARTLAHSRRLEGDTAVPMKVFLVAGRADRGGVGVSPERIHALVAELGLDGFFETSAKEGWQIAELTQAIRDGIDWSALPAVSSDQQLDSIKQFLLIEKQRGRLLATGDDLWRAYGGGQGNRASFDVYIGRVESRGLIRRLHFGDLVLLQPELLDAYASAMVLAARNEPDGLGFLTEEVALAGQFEIPADERVPDKGQERLLLIATVEELLRHEIALKEVSDQGVDLVFPSQYTRERPDAPDIPGKAVVFAFEGTLHSIYATLAVRLARSALFMRRDMWHNAATYAAAGGGVCGISLRELQEDRGELNLFYDSETPTAVRRQFEAYIAAHLRSKAIPGTLTRRIIQICPVCSYALPDNIVRRRLDRGMTMLRCPACDESVISLIDEPAPTVDSDIEAMNRNADRQRDYSAAELRLKGKIETNDYDVFLCYNSEDVGQVKAIADRLRERGILPWFDLYEVQPGARWQTALEQAVGTLRAAVVFLGPRGPGPWQAMETEAQLQQMVHRKRPVIPVILPGRPGIPRLPAFIKHDAIDFRETDPDPFERLMDGITK